MWNSVLSEELVCEERTTDAERHRDEMIRRGVKVWRWYDVGTVAAKLQIDDRLKIGHVQWHQERVRATFVGAGKGAGSHKTTATPRVKLAGDT